MKTKKMKSICLVFFYGAVILFFQGCSSSTTPKEDTTQVTADTNTPVTPPPKNEPVEQPPTGRSHLRVNSINVSTPSASKDQEFDVDLIVENTGNAKSGLINIEIRAAVSTPTGASNVSAGSGSCHALNPGETGQAKIKIKMSHAIDRTGNFLLTPVLQAYQSEIDPNPPQKSIIIN